MGEKFQFTPKPYSKSLAKFFLVSEEHYMDHSIDTNTMEMEYCLVPCWTRDTGRTESLSTLKMSMATPKFNMVHWSQEYNRPYIT